MKTLYQIPILFLIFFCIASKINADGTPFFTGEDVEVWVVKPCSPNSSYGRIDIKILSANAPYTIHYHKITNGIWSPLTPNPIPVMNEGDEDLLNIGPGMYKVEIWDKSCGYIELEIDMEQGDESSIQFVENFHKSLPTGCNTSDGKIEPCKTAGSIYGGIPPFNYLWSNGAETCNISNLANGIYTITVTDYLGCMNVKTTELLTEDALTIEFEETRRPCINSNNGEIDITTNVDAVFEWSVSGGQSTENQSSLHNIGPGTYCVTITGIVSGCTLEKCYSLIGTPANDPVQIQDVMISKPCENTDNGSISLNIENGTYPLIYSWYIPATNQYKHTYQLNQIPVGLYFITVTDFCNHKSTREIQVEPSQLEMDYILDHGCGWAYKNQNTDQVKINKSTIDLTVTGENNPFVVEIKDINSNYKEEKLILNSNFTEVFSNLSNGTYSISLKDNKNCVLTDQVQLQPLIIYHESEEDLEKPCKGTNSGSIKFWVLNPRNLSLKILKGGFEIFETNLASDLFELKQIEDNTPLLLNFNTPECQIDHYYNFKMDSKPTTITLNRYDKTTNTCFFDEECNGEKLTTSSITENGVVDIFDSDENFLTGCDAAIKCRDIEVYRVKSAYLPIYGAVYAAMVETAILFFPYSEDAYYLQKDLDRVYNSSPCHIWKYCPITLRLRHDYWYVDPLCQAFNKPWDEEPDTYVNSNDGCIYSIDCHCGPIIAGKGCLPSSIPASTINNCLPRKMNLATVILFEDQLKLKYPQYTNSTQLYEFVHNTVLPSQIKRNQAVCSNITFCQTDFRILKEPDFDIECNTASVVPVPVGEEDVVGYYIDSEGELQPWDIGSFEYYPTCLLTETGIGICNGSYPRVVCENIELNNQTIIVCPRILWDTIRTVESRIINCDDEIISIQSNSITDNYVYFWGLKDSISNQLIIENRSNDLVFKSNDLSLNFEASDTISLVGADFVTGNITILLNKSDNSKILKKCNNQGYEVWSIILNDLEINNLKQTETGNIEIIGFDLFNNTWSKIIVSNNGIVLSNDTLIIDDLSYNIVRHINGSLITLTKNKRLKFNKNGVQRTYILPENCEITDIKNDVEKIILAGHFKGAMEIGEFSVHSPNFSNAMFLVFDLEGNLLKVHHEEKDRQEYVKGMDINHLDQIVYHGRYHDSIPLSHLPGKFMSDSCVFVSKFSLRDSCMADLNRILYQDSCFLRWDIPENSYQSHLQIYKNNVWNDVLETVESDLEANIQYFYPNNHAQYRVLFTSSNCADTLSNVITVDCKQNTNLIENCVDTLIDIQYDSLYESFSLFFGLNTIDTIFSQSFTFDTLAGYFNEFTRHEIQWDWVKHVRYDSTKTVYYFGTDSIIRSFVTSIDTNGVSNTTWFYDIIFISCGPLNQQGVWTLIGYKVSEQKYYMYVFDKVNLTALPLIIPYDYRGQTYTRVWNFGPDEYATKIISGQYEIIKFSSSAYPPFEVSLSRPFKIKTVNKWESNQWLVSGDLEGTMVIAVDTLISEEWTKSVFIWYDWQGTVVKYKVIESEEERIITHVATDGYQHIFFTGMEIDTVYHENPDSITIETCLFGDTLTVDDFLPSFKQNFNQNTSIASIEKTDGKLRFYPNPFNQGINVQYDSNVEETVLLTCVGMLGNVLFEKQWKVTAGLNEMYLKDFEAVPGGMYSVIVKTSRGDKIHRVIKIE